MYMKMTNLYAPTLKEDPSEAELASHRLLLRAGMIRTCASGLYCYLPLAWRSLRKIEAIVREEMDATGAQELLVPTLAPEELWRATGRWNAYGPDMMRMTDRHGRQFCLGPTQEETITDLVSNELCSYRQLPCNLYQIQPKFRDEMRPRFGLMRAREFIMKDAYSFHATEASLDETYEAMSAAYARMCKRCGIEALPVTADTGEIGGNTSIEYMALAEAGEADIVWCECGFAADIEAATASITVVEGPTAPEVTREHTPGLATIKDVAAHFNIPESATRKALALVDGEGSYVVCIVPGDHDLNSCKAGRAFGEYHLMSDEELEEAGLVKGFIGPIGLPKNVRLVADQSLKASLSWLVGANEVDYHLYGAQPGRDFTVDEWIDIVSAQENDGCPTCGRPLKSARGIEVSQVFKLGTKYSEPLHAFYMDENGQERPMIMGCYGVGVSRMLAAAIEQHNDEHGIIWPVSIAPYEVMILPLNVEDTSIMQSAQTLAEQLDAAGVETVLDDRDNRAGVKFNEADLLGFPLQIILGDQLASHGLCEIKIRRTDERKMIPFDDVVKQVQILLREMSDREQVSKQK